MRGNASSVEKWNLTMCRENNFLQRLALACICLACAVCLTGGQLPEGGIVPENSWDSVGIWASPAGSG